MMSQSVGSRFATGSRPTFSGRALRVAAPKGCGTRRSTMMKAENEPVGYAYAGALVDLAQANSNLDEVHADVDGLSSVLKENSDMADFLTSPVITDEQKKDVLDKLANEAKFTESTTTFLKLVVDKGRADCFEEICEAFESKYCDLTDTQVATLRSAVKLEQEQQFLIAKKLQELTGSKNIKLKPVIDQSLIAGFIVEYGSSQIDLSVKGQVDKIQSELELAAGV
ncbi:hypothetical protein BSKO_01760 [Bryopsis sp. KO-2023]|nr:hypothetical protein BSKO_01760 [Bryopsis sp. KO-2023]